MIHEWVMKLLNVIGLLKKCNRIKQNRMAENRKCRTQSPQSAYFIKWFGYEMTYI